MWEDFGRAFALMLVFEGLVLFAFPKAWGEAIKTLFLSGIPRVRQVGAITIIAGLTILQLMKL